MRFQIVQTFLLLSAPCPLRILRKQVVHWFHFVGAGSACNGLGIGSCPSFVSTWTCFVELPYLLWHSPFLGLVRFLSRCCDDPGKQCQFVGTRISHDRISGLLQTIGVCTLPGARRVWDSNRRLLCRLGGRMRHRVLLRCVTFHVEYFRRA